jgi:DNA polymerase III subunit epsilon
MREIVLDTETTGLDAKKGDRLIEIGCVELANHLPTGRHFHRFIDPEDRDVHPDAERIHGLSTSFLKGKPVFRSVVDEFLAFIGDDVLVIHNAPFDIGFINAELARVKRPLVQMDRVIDTLAIARRKFPAGPNTLDALCKRFGVDISNRSKHGALIDSELLAGVYIELLGERQAALVLRAEGASAETARAGRQKPAKPRPTARIPAVTDADIERHRAFVETLGTDPIWRQFLPPRS